VARNGPEFEVRILKNEQNNTKFAFLNAKDPFHAFYELRVRELGGELAAPPVSAAAEVSKQATVKSAPRVAPLEPPRPAYTVPRPVGVAPLDVDVIQLCAQVQGSPPVSICTGDIDVHISRSCILLSRCNILSSSPPPCSPPVSICIGPRFYISQLYPPL